MSAVGNDYDRTTMDSSFQKGLKAGKLIYLDNLKKKCLQDYELHGEHAVVEKAFQQMKLYIGTHMQKNDATAAASVRQSQSSTRPTPAALIHPTPLARSQTTASDEYEEDFEEVDEEESKVKGAHEASFRRNKKVPPVRAAPIMEQKEREMETPRIMPVALKNPTPSKDPIDDISLAANEKAIIKEMVQSQVQQSSDVVRSSSVPRRGQTIPSWITNREWRLGEKIGAGSFGEVFQCMNNKGKLFAVKKMNMTNHAAELSKLWEEISLMRGLCHKHIVEYIGTFVDAETCSLYIFQEWVPGGSVAHLLKKFGPFTIDVVRNYTRQILFGLVYLHGKNIVHRDIKGGNVLVDDSGIVKLADFGASTRLSALNSTQETATIQGTPYFMAPEVLSNNRYGRKGDIWALGCTMIQMLTGEPPWKDMNLKGIVQLHLLLSGWTGPPPCPRKDLTPEAKECLEMCFQKNPDDRPTAIELLQCRYLRDDELEDSSGLPLDNSLGNTMDNMEDSGVMMNLKREMARALENRAQPNPFIAQSAGVVPPSAASSTGSNVTASPSAASSQVDTIQEIERRMADNRAVRRGSGSANPFGNATPRDRETLDGIAARLPPGNFGSSPTITPRAVKDPITPRGVVKDIFAPTGSPTKTGPSSSNPFARGSAPTADARRVVAGSVPPAEEKFSPSGGVGASAVTSPVAVGTPRGDDDLRRSLQGIKKKANVRAMQIHEVGSTPRASGANPFGRVAAEPLTPNRPQGNLSSARDTEELTPEPFDSDSEEIHVAGQITSRRGGDGVGKERPDLPRYDTRYFDAKYDDSPLPVFEASVSMGSSRGSNKFSREQSVESVEDMADHYYREESARKLVVGAAMPISPIQDATTEDMLFIKPASLRRAQEEKGAGDVVMMKKSASAADGIGVNRRVPRLQALERDKQQSSSSSISVAKSISARVYRPERMYGGDDNSTRPNTSKAALGSVPEHRMVRNVISPRELSSNYGAGEWECLKCGTINHLAESYCDHCATRRGAAGRRGNDAAIYRA